MWGPPDMKNMRLSGCGEFILDLKMVKSILNAKYLLKLSLAKL